MLRPTTFSGRSNALEQRLHGDRDAGRNGATQVLALRSDGVERGGRPEVDDDQALRPFVVRRDGVHDAVRAHLARVVVENGHARLRSRADEERLLVEEALAHLLEGKLHRRHDAGDDHVVYLLELDAGEIEQRAQLQAVLVARAILLRLEPEGVAQLRLRRDFEEPQHRVGVAHVDCQEHASEYRQRQSHGQQTTVGRAPTGPCNGSRRPP